MRIVHQEASTDFFKLLRSLDFFTWFDPDQHPGPANHLGLSPPKQEKQTTKPQLWQLSTSGMA